MSFLTSGIGRRGTSENDSNASHLVSAPVLSVKDSSNIRDLISRPYVIHTAKSRTNGTMRLDYKSESTICHVRRPSYPSHLITRTRTTTPVMACGEACVASAIVVGGRISRRLVMHHRSRKDTNDVLCWPCHVSYGFHHDLACSASSVCATRISGF